MPIKNDVIPAYHWSIKMYTGLPLVIYSVYWPIIGHLYCIASFLYALERDSIGVNTFSNYIHVHLYKYINIQGHSREFLALSSFA